MPRCRRPGRRLRATGGPAPCGREGMLWGCPGRPARARPARAAGPRRSSGYGEVFLHDPGGAGVASVVSAAGHVTRAAVSREPPCEVCEPVDAPAGVGALVLLKGRRACCRSARASGAFGLQGRGRAGFVLGRARGAGSDGAGRAAPPRLGARRRTGARWPCVEMEGRERGRPWRARCLLRVPLFLVGMVGRPSSPRLGLGWDRLRPC